MVKNMDFLKEFSFQNRGIKKNIFQGVPKQESLIFSKFTQRFSGR